MTTYQDKYGEFFGRVNEDGTIRVLHIEDGSPATRLDLHHGSVQVWPVNSELGCGYEHPEGINITRADAERIGLEIEE